jgi:hypothetical protein
MGISMKLSLKTASPQALLYCFIVFYFLLNIFQAGFTGLTSDEGYYWYLSTHLEWGYYDHPPLLALLINLGRHIFSGELGVRFFNVLLMSLSLLFLVKVIDQKEKPKYFLYVMLISLPLLNYITFIVFPDTPLVAISIVYLYFYKKFLENHSMTSSLFMGLTLSAMLYSKYHAVLVPLFIILSNPKLLLDKKFYFSLGIALTLFMPHLYWQYSHNFVSFKYHLIGRSNGFAVNNLTDYLSVQMLVLGPSLIFVPFIYKTKNLFERALKFIILGTLAFFLFATLKGYVHFHWTSIALFPLIILGYTYYSDRKKKLFFILTIPMLLFVVFLRTYLVVKILPINTFNKVDYFHGRQKWAQDIKRVAGTRPVVFENALREAPLYSFYSGMQGIALYPGEDKKSQYEIWGVEDQLQGKDVIVSRDGERKGNVKIATRMGKDFYYMPLEGFASYQNIQISMDKSALQSKNTIRLEIINHRDCPLLFNNNGFGQKIKLICKVFTGGGAQDTTLIIRELSEHDSIAPHVSKIVEGEIPSMYMNRHYSLVFGFDDGVFSRSSNSIKYAL